MRLELRISRRPLDQPIALERFAEGCSALPASPRELARHSSAALLGIRPAGRYTLLQTAMMFPIVAGARTAAPSIMRLSHSITASRTALHVFAEHFAGDSSASAG